MKSMTGFGKGNAPTPEGNASLYVEISSVNRRQLDIKTSIDKELHEFEPLIRQIISGEIARGAIFVSVWIEYSASGAKNKFTVNEHLALEIVRKLRRIQDRMELPGEITINDLLAVPGIVEEKIPELSAGSIEKSLSNALKSALKNLIKMRTGEGAKMKEDLFERLKNLKDCLAEVTPLAGEIPEKQKKRLMRKFEEADIPCPADDERLLKEIVIFSDKSDASEELTRLDSHIEQFHNFINREKGPIGRSMDFLIQEMNREINTLGSKAQDTKICPLVVKLKTELEKIREQVQNIE